MNKKFSVMLLCYAGDNSIHFSEAIESIFNQSLMPSEVVVVQDGPVSDDIEAIIEKYLLKFDVLRLVKLDENMGHGYARARAIEECIYPFVAIMDADDISAFNRFEIQFDLLDKNDKLAVVSSNMAEFAESTDVVISQKVLPSSDHELKRLMKWKCPLNQPSVMFRKECLLSVGGYIDWFNNEDYFLWIRLAAANYEFHNIQDNLIFFRVDHKVFERRGGWKYFQSEFGIQKLLLKEGIGNIASFTFGVSVRFIVQVLLPNKFRQTFYRIFLRK